MMAATAGQETGKKVCSDYSGSRKYERGVTRVEVKGMDIDIGQYLGPPHVFTHRRLNRGIVRGLRPLPWHTLYAGF